MKLRWKVTGAYAALIAVLALGLAWRVKVVATQQIVQSLREGLIAQARLTRLLIESVPSAQMEEAVRQVARDAGVRVTVIAPDGRVLADSEADVGTMEPHDTRPEVVQAREQGTGWAIRHSATLNIDMLYVAEHAGPESPTVRLALALEVVRQATAGLERSIVLAGLVAAGLAILVGFWTTGGITRSLDDLARAARRIGRGDLAARAHVRAGDETRELAETLNAMAEGLASARAELERKATHLAAVLAQMADGVIVTTPDETIQLFNRAAGVLLGVDPDTALVRRLSEAVQNYDLVELARRAARVNTSAQAEVVVDGSAQRTLAAVASPLAGEGGEPAGVVITLRDISELKRLEAVRRDFVANASHELRTPVAAIRSLSETLQGGALQEPEVASRFLSQIVASTENLAQLLDDMLALATLEAPEEGPEPQLLGVRAALVEAAARLGPQAAEKRITVSVDASEELKVWCAEQHLTAALVNLVDNAVKYTPEGGSVRLGAEAEGDLVRLTVTDTGPGIPEADRSRVFERFYRVDRGRSRALGGTGLGLSIVKHAVESSGGRVWIEAPPEGGTRVVVQLPAGPSPLLNSTLARS